MDVIQQFRPAYDEMTVNASSFKLDFKQPFT